MGHTRCVGSMYVTIGDLTRGGSGELASVTTVTRTWRPPPPHPHPRAMCQASPARGPLWPALKITLPRGSLRNHHSRPVVELSPQWPEECGEGGPHHHHHQKKTSGTPPDWHLNLLILVQWKAQKRQGFFSLARKKCLTCVWALPGCLWSWVTGKYSDRTWRLGAEGSRVTR